uniref:DDE Tnp4 domain-containing protein n=1 Tax=Brassica oleracea var. oleracea TaxID=109376 RepID=A0A0D3A8F5_BRAOL
MSSSSSSGVDEMLNEAFDEMFDQEIDSTFDSIVDVQANKPRRRAYIERDREQGHNILWNDYFRENPTYPPQMFRRRFRMNKPLFLRIVDHLTAIRMMAYGQSGDTYDEYLRLGESTALLCLENFTNGIIQLFGDEYLRRPTPEDLQRLLDVGEVRGFPGMIGSIDCMHWEWKNCPTAWRGQYTRGSAKPTIVFEAVASDDLWIWHTFFGLPVKFKFNSHNYRIPYYLTDGIYPKWSTFIQSIPLPQGPKAELFAERQESVRKDVERAFAVLQSRFAIVKNPARLWDKEKIGRIMRISIILHNMIVENERHRYTLYDTSDFVAGESSRSSQVDFSYSTEIPSYISNMLPIRNQIRDQQIHDRLKADLAENIWQKFGNLDE